MNERYMVELNTDDAYWFMCGFATVSIAEQQIIAFLYENGGTYRGTYSSLCLDMEYSDGYTSEVNRACHRLERDKIIETSEPINWYTRYFILNKDWVQKLIAKGKENSKYVRKDQLHQYTQKTGVL